MDGHPSIATPSEQTSIDVQMIYDRLHKAHTGDIVSYGDLTGLIGRDVQQAARYILLRALDLLRRDHNYVFGTVRRVGVKRLSDGEIVGAAASDVASIRRKARKAAAKLTCVGDYDALTADEHIRHNATVSLFGAIHSMTKRPQVKKLEAAVQTTGRTLPLARTLEAFTR
jgi:hypothetical protein